MKNNWVSWVAILALVLAVVALVVVLRSEMTGNTIKVPNFPNGSLVYTKAEVDIKLANLTFGTANNAKACNGDSVCEANKIYLSSQYTSVELTSFLKFNTTSNGFSSFGPSGVVISKPGTSTRITEKDITTGRLYLNDLQNQNGSSGQYLCVFDSGMVYKSANPCA